MLQREIPSMSAMIPYKACWFFYFSHLNNRNRVTAFGITVTGAYCGLPNAVSTRQLADLQVFKP
jgi:hypothetical protein